MNTRPDGETDITSVFGTDGPGSIPGRGTRNDSGWRATISERGYGLVVERVLAKDETGVRFSLSAPNETEFSGSH